MARRGGYGKQVFFTDLSIMESPKSNYLKKLAKLKNRTEGTKSKFSGPFTEEELERFNSIYGTGKW